MEGHLILVDANNIGFAAMQSPRLSAGLKETHGTFTFIRQIRNIYLEFPQALILCLFDGRSWRKSIYTEYKEKRQSTEKQQEDRQAYYNQKRDMLKALDLLGVPHVFAANLEADDLAEIHSRKWKGDKVTLWTGDKDWLQLVDERTDWYDPIFNRYCNIKNFEAFTGFKDSEQFVEAKCILGDKDEVPGLKGIGPKTLEKVYSIWYSFYYGFLDCTNQDDLWYEHYGVDLPKVLDDCRWKHKETWNLIDFNRKLADLKHPDRPEPIGLLRTQMELDEEKFKDFCFENSFLSFVKDFNLFIKPFKENRFVRICETSKAS